VSNCKIQDVSRAVGMLILLSICTSARAEEPKDIDLRCGAYCLYTALKALDLPVPEYDDLEAKLGQPSQLGYSLDQLDSAARQYHAHTLPVETSLDNLEARNGRFACIALLERSKHFVCVYDIDDSNVYIIDPPGHDKMSRSAFAALWQGKALLLSDKAMSPLSTTDYARVAILCLSLAACAALALLAGRKYLKRNSLITRA